MIKRCPSCGTFIPTNMENCPVCGAKIYSNNNLESTKKSIRLLGKSDMNLTAWEIALIFICNITLVMIILNLIFPQNSWFLYPVVIIFASYFLIFAALSKNLKRFITRYRNAVIIMNAIIALCTLITNLMTNSTIVWPYEYFIPSNLLVANTVMIILLLFSNTSIVKVVFSIFAFNIQSLILFVLLLAGVLGGAQLSRILIILAFGINFITLINLSFIYIAKFRNKLIDEFKFWE